MKNRYRYINCVFLKKYIKKHRKNPEKQLKIFIVTKTKLDTNIIRNSGLYISDIFLSDDRVENTITDTDHFYSSTPITIKKAKNYSVILISNVVICFSPEDMFVYKIMNIPKTFRNNHLHVSLNKMVITSNKRLSVRDLIDECRIRYVLQKI